MKFIVSLIFSLAIGLLFTNIVWAYCVFNDSSITVTAEDSRYQWPNYGRYWYDGEMNPGDSGCCPGGNHECQNASIDAWNYGGEPGPHCPGDTPVADHGWMEITGDSQGLKCTAYNTSPVKLAINTQKHLE